MQAIGTKIHKNLAIGSNCAIMDKTFGGKTMINTTLCYIERDEHYLDIYEGYPNFYYKKELEITFTGILTKRKRTRTAFVYIMHEERPLGLPSKGYLDVCAEGYRDFDFDLTRLFQAYNDSKEEL